MKIDDDTYRRYRAKAAHCAIRAGHADDAEDFAQEAVIRLWEGRTTKLKYMLIDYLRKVYGRTGVRGSRSRPGKSYNSICVYEASERLGDDNAMDAFDAIGRDPKPEPADFRYARGVTELQREVASAYLIDGLNLNETGEQFGFSESRASQVVAAVRKKMADGAILGTCLEDYLEDEERNSVRINWIEL
jgi:DNA-directed RNA polymerase specialized sigma24 family protein